MAAWPRFEIWEKEEPADAALAPTESGETHFIKEKVVLEWCVEFNVSFRVSKARERCSRRRYAYARARGLGPKDRAALLAAACADGFVEHALPVSDTFSCSKKEGRPLLSRAL